MDLASGEDGECWRRGLRAGMASDAASGMTRSGGGTEVWRFGAAAANHHSPSGDGEGTFCGMEERR